MPIFTEATPTFTEPEDGEVAEMPAGDDARRDGERPRDQCQNSNLSVGQFAHGRENDFPVTRVQDPSRRPEEFLQSFSQVIIPETLLHLVGSTFQEPAVKVIVINANIDDPAVIAIRPSASLAEANNRASVALA